MIYGGGDLRNFVLKWAVMGNQIEFSRDKIVMEIFSELPLGENVPSAANNFPKRAMVDLGLPNAG